jgi:hypothetical protein
MYNSLCRQCRAVLCQWLDGSIDDGFYALRQGWHRAPGGQVLDGLAPHGILFIGVPVSDASVAFATSLKDTTKWG